MERLPGAIREILKEKLKRNEENFEDNYLKHQNNFMEHSDILYPDYVAKEENYKKLEDCIKKLKEDQRICIDLFYLQDKSYVEVSQITSYSMKEVKTYIQNGKRNLKILMETKK